MEQNVEARVSTVAALGESVQILRGMTLMKFFTTALTASMIFARSVTASMETKLMDMFSKE